MFDIGWTELLVIAVVAIIVVGPKDLPAMLRTLGRYAGKVRRTASEFRSQFDEALRESELDELRSTMRDMGSMNPANEIRDSVNESLDPLRQAGDDIKRGVEDDGGSRGAGGSGGTATAIKGGAGKPEAPQTPAPQTPAPKTPGAGKPPAAAASPSAPRKRAAKSAAKSKTAARSDGAGGLRKKTAAKAKTTSSGTGA